MATTKSAPYRATAKEMMMTLSGLARGGAVALVVLTLLAGCVSTGGFGSASNSEWSDYYNNIVRAEK